MTNELKWTKALKFNSLAGSQVLNASESNVQLSSDYTDQIDALLAQMSAGGEGALAARQQFGASIAEPIQQIIPYVSQFDRFFMGQNIGDTEDNLIAVEDLVNIAYESAMSSEVKYNQPGYRFVRPTWTYFQTGFRLQWQTLRKAGWNLLGRQMNYVAWELARKIDAKAKTVLDAAIPASHRLSVSGSMTKAIVDQVIRQSAQIGFPAKNALINPGRLMEMQQWTWIMPQISNEVGKELVENLFYGRYGGVNWYAHPYAPVDKVYFFSDPSQIGWHQTKGSPRTDTQVNITTGEDLYAMRSAEHAFYVGAGIGLWSVTVS